MEYKENIEDYGLDLKCTMMVEDYRAEKSMYDKIKDIVLDQLRNCLDTNHILVTAVEARVKTEQSLVGKLELKGYKYRTLDDITDIVGARVITFYSDEVDKIATLIESIFEVDWDESVDKRKLLGKDTFGYMSLHYVCRIPKKLYFDPQYPKLNDIRFEVQMRTTLQHVWANMNHDTGYKSGVEIPAEYSRTLVRLAGLLELADDEFSRIRREINDYRRRVEQLVKDGDFDQVELNSDTFRSYLATDPFSALNRKISDINQAEIQPVNGMQYLEPLLGLGFKTLGDIERLKNEYGEAAYQLALHHLSGTDLDIISSMLGLQNLCLVYIVEEGSGEPGVKKFLDIINGVSPYNDDLAKRITSRIKSLPCMQQKNENQ